MRRRQDRAAPAASRPEYRGDEVHLRLLATGREARERADDDRDADAEDGPVRRDAQRRGRYPR